VIANNNLESWQGAKLPIAIPLNGRWVTLEPLSAAHHAHALWSAVEGHDEVWTWLGDGPYSREKDLAEALVAQESGAAARFFAIVPPVEPSKTAEAKGYASLMRIDAANGVIEVGNVLFSPSLQRTAAATEAMYLLARYVFEDLGYRRYEWKCNANNLPSRRAAERLGFTFEGVFRQHMVVKGKNRDTAWFAMLDSEWPERKRAFEAWLAPANFDADGRQRQSLQCVNGSV
jgi:RimJ/RimL family protein N-acetyltransferase